MPVTFMRNRRKQLAIYWSKTMERDETGRLGSYNLPRIIQCRWEDKKTEVIDESGTKVIANSKVTVMEDLHTGGFLKLTDTDDLTNVSDDPSDEPMTRRIAEFRVIPSVCNQFKQRVAMVL